MAETLISPGVLTRENDNTQVTQQPISVGAAIIGPTVKGPVEVPTYVTSYSQFQNIFGDLFTSGSGDAEDTYSYFTSIAAYNYFQNGGTSLLVARVVNGTYTSATSSISSSNGLAFELETISKGAMMNSTSSLSVNGALESGSRENIRWEISAPDTGSGQFSLLIRRGDDNGNNKVILETWNNLSLDPKQSNYIARVIGDLNETYDVTENQVEVTGQYPNASSYVRVKNVFQKTPNYLDNDGNARSQYTGSIPVASSGSFGGAAGTIAAGANFYENINSSNIQGLQGSDYTNMINLLSNKDDYRYNILVVPGLYKADYSSQISTIAVNSQNRGDNLFIADMVNYQNGTVTAVKGQAVGLDNTYVATYWPWVRIVEPATGKDAWVPASTILPGVIAFNDRIGEPWFAPAGFNRGGLSLVNRVQKKLNASNRDELYSSNVNPIASFPGRGIVVWGQKTLQKASTALTSVNVRRLLIELKDFLGQTADNMVFEDNSNVTRNRFLSIANPYLESVKQRRGVYAFRVTMDETNNTNDVIDRLELRGAIEIQPTRTGEKVILDFNLSPTGATFS